MKRTKISTPISVPEHLPFLEKICWQTKNVYLFTPEQMLSCYERGWKYLNLFDSLGTEELNFIRQIAYHYKSWLMTEL